MICRDGQNQTLNSHEYLVLCPLTPHSSTRSNLSLASEEAESPESFLVRTSGSFSDGSRTRPFEKTSETKQHYPHDLHVKGERSAPPSLPGSFSDVPVLLINGAPQRDLDIHRTGLEMDLTETVSGSRSKPCLPQSASQRTFSYQQPHCPFLNSSTY